VVALGILVALVMIAILAPLLAPHPPYVQPDPVALRAQAPSLAYPFGTDLASRDVLSRVIHGARISLPIALLSVLLSATVGTAYGAVAGYASGRVDSVMMRLIDAALAIPRILLLIAVLALWGAISAPMLVLVIGLTGWFQVSRLVRAEVLSLRDQDLVQAARALGASRRRIVIRHIIPSVLSPVLVAATLAVGNVIVLEAGLSFLGIGVQQPDASWGNMIADATANLRAYWWLSLFPGMAILVTVMSFNVLGDGLRDALDTRQVVRP
jgi:peptide/nickel transport system permease protein